MLFRLFRRGTRRAYAAPRTVLFVCVLLAGGGKLRVVEGLGDAPEAPTKHGGGSRLGQVAPVVLGVWRA